MKRYQLLGIGLILFSFVLSEAAESAVPQALNYRGRLVDAGGAPVADGNHFIKFALYDSESAGAELWNSNIRIITTTDGLFSYNLGSNVPLPAGLFLSNSSLYLGITIGTDAEISPRTALTSSAFAFQSLHADSAQFALDADLLDGKDATQFTTDTELSAHQSDQSSHHRKTSIASEITQGVFSLARLPVGTSFGQIAPGDHAHTSNVGNVFTHWGSHSAPTGSTLLYVGFGYSSWYNHTGNIPPMILAFGASGPVTAYDGGLLYPVQIAEAGTHPPGVTPFSLLLGSVCFSEKPTFVMWNSPSPPAGWRALYTGYVMGPHWTHPGSSGPICVDNDNFLSQLATGGTPTFVYGVKIKSAPSAQSARENKFVRCVVCQKE